VSITPSSSSSKILLIAKEAVRCPTGNAFGAVQWYRGGTALLPTPQTYEFGNASSDTRGNLSHVILDAPATTSSVTYTLYIRCYTGSFTFCPNNFYSSCVLMEVVA
jgi:hypothetical protein